MTREEALRALTARAERVERVPVQFTAAGHVYASSAYQLGIQLDLVRAVDDAADKGGGIRPVRGLRRLQMRLFGAAVEPTVTVYPTALDFRLRQLREDVGRSAVAASLRQQGLGFRVVDGREGRALDVDDSRDVIVQALSSFERGASVALPVTVTTPRVKAVDLTEALAEANRAISAPVRLVHRQRVFRLPRWRIAQLLRLPAAGRTQVEIGGRPAEKYFARLARSVERKPVSATFTPTATGGIALVPARQGVALDVPAAAARLRDVLVREGPRMLTLPVAVARPERTTTEARAMGITGVVGRYTTSYGGTPGRLHNVQLVAKLIDNHFIPPGAIFSFNETTGERTADKGFEVAPVIISGELQNGLGGGVCQVSTTVFNAAFDAGLPIVERTNHALFISHYPQGRDATVDFPSIDLKFRNDTGRWLLLRTFVGAGSLTVALYGTPQDRRVETSVAPLSITGPVPVKKIKDPTLPKGKRVVEAYGVQPRATSVHRVVYSASGELLFDTVFNSSYVGEPTIVHVGTKPVVKPAGAAGAGSEQKGGSTGPTGPAGPTSPPTPQP